MGLFDKFKTLSALREQLIASGHDPFNVEIEQLLSPTEGQIAGRRTLLAGTNNYLGLTFDPECIAAACQAVEQEGTGTTGSRLANGNFASHLALEQELADFYNCRSAIVFSTGYLANLGVLATLADTETAVLLDADCHASIYDGCRMSGAEVFRFRHNDVGDLDKRLRRLGPRAANSLVVIEGLYSMRGDQAPLAEIAAVKQDYGSYLLVDEAHSLGVLGPKGQGLAEELGVSKNVDFFVGTFSKSLGATGGFCASNLPELDLIRYASRPYIFTASPTSSVVASTRKALSLLQSRPELRQRLWKNAYRLHAGLKALEFRVEADPAPIIAVKLVSKIQALTLWQGLLERGVYVNLMIPPATPAGISLIRCSVSAAHSPGQIETILEAFEKSLGDLETGSGTKEGIV